jgi:hypothetical protein
VLSHNKPGASEHLDGQIRAHYRNGDELVARSHVRHSADSKRSGLCRVRHRDTRFPVAVESLDASQIRQSQLINL